MYASERELYSEYLRRSEYELSRRAAERWSVLQAVAESRRQQLQRRSRLQARRRAAVATTG